MNVYLLLAGIIAAFTCVGHFTYGRKHFLWPMQAADFDPVAKAIMHCVFHYVSVFLVLSSLVLLACSFEAISQMQSFGMLIFIALNFGLFAIWQLYIGFMSSLEAPFKSLFQWVFFVPIALLTFAGAILS
ncbi:conserved hypothetical protein [Shewanella halifaxensis HAW-EB4]|uniref:Uncharacterized protein n=1 Tax=Shewanella halifaxensis (strain HAW-EB4) TaxID=458817 RepID=B0TJL4_SHEHH|nr:hypothetical protein [Shewanella halifaxensis]ABZ77010.1 conserved hypothetical protein [Shewanella halifaxensis HAW-EB4]